MEEDLPIGNQGLDKQNFSGNFFFLTIILNICIGCSKNNLIEMFNLNIFIANIKQGVGPQVFSNISNGPSP